MSEAILEVVVVVAVVVCPLLKLKQTSYILGPLSDLNLNFFGLVPYKIMQIEVFQDAYIQRLLENRTRMQE